MKRLKDSLFYIFIIGASGFLMYWIMSRGSMLENGRSVVIPSSGKSQWSEFLLSVSSNLRHPLAILLLQIITIILAARLLGWVCKKIATTGLLRFSRVVWRSPTRFRKGRMTLSISNTYVTASRMI